MLYREGDRVFCTEHGVWGMITDISECPHFPIQVQLEAGYGFEEYTADGKILKDNFEPQLHFTEQAPRVAKRPVPEAKIGDLLLGKDAEYLVRVAGFDKYDNTYEVDLLDGTPHGIYTKDYVTKIYREVK